MEINYHKSDMFPINLNKETHSYAKILCCKIGSFPFKYMRVPLHYEKLRIEDIQPIIDKILLRIPRWKGRLLSYGARVALLQKRFLYRLEIGFWCWFQKTIRIE
jgi:hypothetical protein